MDAHPFDQAIALARQPDGRWLGHTSPAYANRVGPLGGVMAAQAINAVLQHPDRLGEPVAVTVNFASAMADGPFEVRAKAARTNRSTQHWVVEVTQSGQAVLTATVFTALRRDTWNAQDMAMPAVAGATDTPRNAGPGRVAWFDRYELRFLHGYFPADWDGSNSGDSITRLWMRDDPPRPLDFASLTALADVFYPRIWRRRRQIRGRRQGRTFGLIGLGIAQGIGFGSGRRGRRPFGFFVGRDHLDTQLVRREHLGCRARRTGFHVHEGQRGVEDFRAAPAPHPALRHAQLVRHNPEHRVAGGAACGKWGVGHRRRKSSGRWQGAARAHQHPAVFFVGHAHVQQRRVGL